MFCRRGIVVDGFTNDGPLARRGRGGKTVFTSDFNAVEARDETDFSLGVDSNGGFLGTGGAGFRLVLELEDATDARLGNRGPWEVLLVGISLETARKGAEWLPFVAIGVMPEVFLVRFIWIL